MFKLFKKKEPVIPLATEQKLSDEAIALVKQQLAEKKQQLEQELNKSMHDQPLIAKLYEDMGLLAVSIDQDIAINYLENSLSYKQTINDGYKCLMGLYNQKRAEAAKNGDYQGIEQWMNKMDGMRQIVKQVIISG